MKKQGSLKPCRAPHGARGLKYACYRTLIKDFSRAPHGARGLKYPRTYSQASQNKSRPARGAWIEIFTGRSATFSYQCRAPHGARGLKYQDPEQFVVQDFRRAPHGARGLK